MEEVVNSLLLREAEEDEDRYPLYFVGDHRGSWDILRAVGKPFGVVESRKEIGTECREEWWQGFVFITVRFQVLTGLHIHLFSPTQIKALPQL